MPNSTLWQKIGLIVFGLFLCAAMLEIGLRLGGFIILLFRDQRNKVSSVKANNEYRIMCLGESTTARGGEDSWPVQLEEILNARYRGRSIKVLNKGIEGVNTGVLVSSLENNIDTYNPNMVIAMIGVNDGSGTVLFENSFRIKMKLFLKDFRAYKLFKVLSQNIMIKINDEAAKITLANLLKTEKLLKIASSPGDFAAAEGKLKKLFSQGKHKEVSKILEKLIESTKSDKLYELYMGLVYCYMMQERYKEAEELFKKAIELDPGNAWAYKELGLFYRQQGRVKEAVRVLEIALKSSTVDYALYHELGYCYKADGESKKAEGMFRKTLELNPEFEPAYTELGNLFREQGRISDIKELGREIIEKDVDNDCLYGFAGTSYREQGRDQEAEEYYKKANDFRLKYYNPAIRHNYRKLKETLAQRGIMLVCVQYPMRSIEPLKKLFDSTDGLIFVDNEKIFKDAVKQAKYEDYFTDNFGGDFGHCTPRGNRLLAENIAKVLTKEVFNK